MAIQLHHVEDNFTATLNGAVNNSVTSFTLTAGHGLVSGDMPVYFYVDSEIVEGTAISTNTLTVTRGALSTSAAAHNDGSKVKLYNTAQYVQELQDRVDALSAAVCQAWGGGDGVVRADSTNGDFEVVAQDTPDMTVKVKGGARASLAFVTGREVFLTADSDTAAISAPSANPRIDIVQVSQYNTISIKTGAEAGSPSAPIVDTNNLKLAEIYCRVGMVHIDDTDDASNGYITDSRTYV